MTYPKINTNVSVYGIYTMLYVNDMAFNAIRDISRVAQSADKETKKIYGALRKRVKAYFTYTYKVLGEESQFLADFNEYIDEINEPTLETFEKGIKYVLQRNGIQDDELNVKTILALTMVELASCNIRAICEKMKEEGLSSGQLHTWEQKEIHRIMANLYTWVTRKIPSEVKAEISSLANAFVTKIGENIGDYDNFMSAYEYARNKKNENGFTHD